MDPADLLTVTVGHDPDHTPVVILSGQLDLATAHRAQDAFASVGSSVGSSVDGSHAGNVVVDMTDLTFMDSSGLTVLLTAVRRGYALRLRRPTNSIRRLIAATGLTQTLPVEPLE